MNVSAFLLHRRPFRERGLWVSLFTYEHGRVNAIGRGKSGAGSSCLMPLQPLVVELSGQGELKTLRLAEPAAPLVKLSGLALYCSFYLNELLYRLLPAEDSCPELFDHYLMTLESLSQTGGVQPLLREFERHLLITLGFELVFPDDPDVCDAWYFSPERGDFSRMPGRGPDGVDYSLGPLSPPELLAAAAGNWAGVQRVARRLHRARLDFILGARPLKSRELISQYLEMNREKKGVTRGQH